MREQTALFLLFLLYLLVVFKHPHPDSSARDACGPRPAILFNRCFSYPCSSVANPPPDFPPPWPFSSPAKEKNPPGPALGAGSERVSWNPGRLDCLDRLRWAQL